MGSRRMRRASQLEVQKTGYFRRKDWPVQRPQDGTKLVTFENLKMTKVARVLGIGDGVEKGE